MDDRDVNWSDISDLEVSIIDLDKRLKLVEMALTSPRRITVPGTTTAGTQAVQWDAPEAEPTTPTPSPSQSPTAEQQSGVVEPSSECAHKFVAMRYNMDFQICHLCRNAWMYEGQILVPVAPTT